MSHAHKADKLLIKPAAGRQTGAALPPGQIIPKARNAASHPTSHKQHGDTRLATAPRQTDPLSLTVPRRLRPANTEREMTRTAKAADPGGKSCVRLVGAPASSGRRGK